MIDPPREQAGPGTVERAARYAVLVFLVLASLTLAFGLGYGVNDLTSSDSPSPAASGGSASQPAAASGPSAVLNEIIGILQQQYVDRKDLNTKALNQASIDGLITALNDRETHYLTQDDLKAGALDLNSTYEGIGASVSSQSGSVQIVAPFRDSPAEKAGIRSGDIILEVNGEKTDGWTDQFAVEKIRGPKGTDVTLTVKHTDGTTQTLQVTRGDIAIQSVFTEPHLEVIPGESGTKLVDSTGKEATDIAYINISQFHERTDSELRDAAKDIETKGYRGLILDLRGNPGGLLSATVDVADEFLDKGTIITEVDGDGQKTSTSAKAGGILTHIPIVILLDSGSASGAEVLASALRDDGRATIVGTRSYGKGTVNRLMPLKSCGDPAGCGALYLAIGRWLTPKGDQIEGLGIKPDIELPMTSQQYVDNGDIQVFKAIDILRGKQ